METYEEKEIRRVLKNQNLEEHITVEQLEKIIKVLNYKL